MGLALVFCCATASACIPVEADPYDDASEAEGISAGRVESRHDFPTTAIVGRSVWIVSEAATLKGIMPRTLIVPLGGCGGPRVAIGERVIVVRLGHHLVARPAGGVYEAQLRQALRMRAGFPSMKAP